MLLPLVVHWLLVTAAHVLSPLRKVVLFAVPLPSRAVGTVPLVMFAAFVRDVALIVPVPLTPKEPPLPTTSATVFVPAVMSLKAVGPPVPPEAAVVCRLPSGNLNPPVLELITPATSSLY